VHRVNVAEFEENCVTARSQTSVHWRRGYCIS